jgi:hypothetical protein
MAGALWFKFCTRGSFMTVAYYLPIWFQAIKDSSATKSGLQLLPLILLVVIFSIMPGAGESVFSNRLVSAIRSVLPDFDSNALQDVGATSLRNVVPSGELDAVLRAYNEALVQTWHVAVAVATLSILGTVIVEWRNVKMKKNSAIIQQADVKKRF